MTKEKYRQNVSMETRARKGRKRSRSRNIVLNLEGNVINLNESMGGVKDYMAKAFNSNWDAMRETLNATMDDQIEKLTKKNDALEALFLSSAKWMFPNQKSLKGQGIEDDAIKVNTIIVDFIDVTLLWWHHSSIDEKQGGMKIETWEELQKELKKQFYPQYVKEDSWAKLCRLMQQGIE
ncbi:hypothetical protein Goari_025191 [Gossypium aridum]|uniref:Retrotransposon gag domain-containing protein n=1 Tax=Gossypium aridum TaxID=34290 RepID=A0A7J8X8K9_GOSAI|nr:hypothetical protein [Gossypium aridum]